MCKINNLIQIKVVYHHLESYAIVFKIAVNQANFDCAEVIHNMLSVQSVGPLKSKITVFKKLPLWQNQYKVPTYFKKQPYIAYGNTGRITEQ